MANTARRRRSHHTDSTSHHRAHNHREPPLKPIIPPILPPPLPPISVEEKPAEQPQKAVPLIKTQYNTKRLQTFIAVGISAGVLGLGAAILINWPQIQQIFGGQQSSQTAQYKLNVQAEKLDAPKAQQIMQQIRQSTVSATGQSTPSASPTEIPGQLSIPSADVLSTYSTDQLLQILDSQIQQLQSEKQSIRLLELLKSSGAKTDLLKAIQLGKEYQALYLYYKK